MEPPELTFEFGTSFGAGSTYRQGMLDDNHAQDQPQQLQQMPAESASASSSAQPSRPSKKGRVMGVSCDNCKVRKVKCDRRERLQKKRETQGADFPAEDVSCSNCVKHSLKCSLTKTAPKARTGARLRELHQKERDGVKDGRQAVVSPSASSSTAQSLSETLSSSPWNLSVATAKAVAGNSSRSLERYDDYDVDDFGMTQFRHTGLLQVPGLTRHILEACLQAFFTWVGPTSVAIRAHEFSIGYRSFFDLYQGRESKDRPVSEGLILALGAVGAGMLEDDAPLGSMGKFTLQQRLATRFLEYLNEYRWIERSDEESIDLLVGSYCMSFLDIEEPENDGQDGDNPFSRRPLSDEFLASLVFKLKLNRAAKLEPRAPVDGPRWRTGRGERLLDDWEIVNRKRIFFSCFYNDGFRAMSTRRAFKISNDSHDLDYSLPRAPRYDPGFTPHGELPLELSPDGHFQPLFERIYLHYTGRLSLLVRKHGPTFISTRSQGLGVPLQAAIDSHKEFVDLYSELPDDISVWRRIPVDWKDGPAVRPTGYELFKLIRCLFLEMLYHGHMSGAVTAVQDFGWAQDSASSNVDADEFLLDMKVACFDSLRKVAKLSRQMGTMGMLRCSPVVCRNLNAGFLLWACNVVSCLLTSGSTSIRGMSLEELLFCCDEILFGISTVDSAEGTPKMHAALCEYLDKVKNDCRGSLQADHRASSTPSDHMLPQTGITELPADMQEFLTSSQTEGTAGLTLTGVEAALAAMDSSSLSFGNHFNPLASANGQPSHPTGDLLDLLVSQEQSDEVPLPAQMMFSRSPMNADIQGTVGTQADAQAQAQLFEQFLAGLRTAND